MNSPTALFRPILLALAAATALASCSGGSSSPGAGAVPTAPEVRVVSLAPQSVTLTRELPGRTSASLVAEMRPQVTGIVKQRLFSEGGTVKAGEALYQLDDATYRADVASATAALARAEATLATAGLNARRSAELVKIDAVSRQDDESATAQLKQAEADVAVARAALERSRILLDYARISSPIAGRIGRSAVTQGALVTANQAQALATVQQLDPIHVDVTRSSAELLELRRQVADGRMKEAAGLPVEIVLEDGSRHRHPGKLTFSDVTVDPGTGTYTLRVVVPNPGSVLQPGTYVRAIVGSGVREGGLLVPQAGITRDPKGNATALLLDSKGKVEQRAVKVSQTVGDQWLVEEGLSAGDRVIVEGLQKVRPGVTAKAAAPAPAAAPGK